MTVSIRDIYWTAGFLEGDGSFMFRNRTLIVSASQAQEWPLQKLQSLYGGTIRKFIHDNPNWNDTHIWSIYGPTAAGLMMTLYPRMFSRRQGQILKALNGWKKQKVHRRLK